MKLTTSFALPVRKTILIIFLISVLSSLVGIATIYHLGVDRVALLNESASMKHDVAILESKSKIVAKKNQHDTLQVDISSMRSRIDRINAISPIKGATVNQVLLAVENLLPVGVSIDRMSYSALDGQLHIIAETTDAELVYAFMKRIEQNTMFSSPELQQKPGQELTDRGVMQFEIHVMVKSS